MYEKLKMSPKLIVFHSFRCCRQSYSILFLFLSILSANWKKKHQSTHLFHFYHFQLYTAMRKELKNKRSTQRITKIENFVYTRTKKQKKSGKTSNRERVRKIANFPLTKRVFYIWNILSVAFKVSIDNWKVNLHCRWFSKPIFNYAYLHVICILVACSHSHIYVWVWVCLIPTAFFIHSFLLFALFSSLFYFLFFLPFSFAYIPYMVSLFYWWWIIFFECMSLACLHLM